MIAIREIDFTETFAVRHPVLREGKPIETCFFDGDDLSTTHHFGAFVNKKIIGVVSVYQNKKSTFNAEKQYQIRGMAVLNAFQKKGVGEQLVLHCEQYVLEQNGEVIWFNARESAVGFYEKLNYQQSEAPFMILDIGWHTVMYKKLV